jgi:hypothetical protein
MAETKLANVLFWPSTPFPWVAGMLAFTFLALFGFQRLPLVDKFTTSPSDQIMQSGLLIAGLVLVFNLVLFWQHVAPHYVRRAVAIVPWLVTFAILSAVFLLVYIWTRPSVTGSSPSVLQAFLMSQLGVYVTMTTSQLWVGPKPNAELISANRDRAVAIITDLQSKRMSPEDRVELITALTYLETAAVSATIVLRSPKDRSTVHRWKTAAAAVKARIKDIDSSQIRYEDVHQAAKELLI